MKAEKYISKSKSTAMSMPTSVPCTPAATTSHLMDPLHTHLGRLFNSVSCRFYCTTNLLQAKLSSDRIVLWGRQSQPSFPAHLLEKAVEAAPHPMSLPWGSPEPHTTHRSPASLKLSSQDSSHLRLSLLSSNHHPGCHFLARVDKKEQKSSIKPTLCKLFLKNISSRKMLMIPGNVNSIHKMFGKGCIKHN